ncbi:MAG: efflux RND transporter permease subunit [Verrucomicrobiales bacterium]
MAIAGLQRLALILFALAGGESLVVAVAIPSTLALTLLVFYLYGFTLNRITLFALIFSIGILVDDAIGGGEHRALHRDHATGKAGGAIRSMRSAQVGNPTILATRAVIFAVLPMAFVGGCLMGPYMRPIPVGASAAMTFSLLIAPSPRRAAVRVLRWWKARRGSRSMAPPDGSGHETRFLHPRALPPGHGPDVT